MAANPLNIKWTLADRIIEVIDPVRARARLQARMNMAVAGQWLGGRLDRRETKNWVPLTGSADADMLFDLPTMRARSRDMMRNSPLALGAINTVVTSTVGTGLSLMPTPDAEALGMSDEEAEDWSALVLREFNAWAENASACDAARRLTFFQLQELAFRSALEAGDCFALLPMIPTPASHYELKVQLIEADRVCNKDGAMDSDQLAGGVQLGLHGEPLAYHILKSHPGSFAGSVRREWSVVDVFGKTSGRRNALHIADMRRIGQTRGYPYLAPVMEPLRQLQRYTEAEIMAAVVSGMFTVFVQTDSGQGFDLGPDGQPIPSGSPAKSGSDMKLGNGAIVDLAPGEQVNFADPGRPNTAFDPFVQAVLRQIGVALELPFEVLIKHFTASYTAARAAIQEAWRFFKGRRAFLATTFCQPVYEAWLEEAIAIGRVPAPGFFDDPMVRAAYCAAEWIGDAPGQVDPLKEVQSSKERINAALSNHSIETMALLGLPWRSVHKLLAKEVKEREEDGTMSLGAPMAAPAAPGAPGAQPAQQQDNGGGDGEGADKNNSGDGGDTESSDAEGE